MSFDLRPTKFMMPLLVFCFQGISQPRVDDRLLRKEFRQMDEGLWISKYETTRAEYAIFLNDLVRSGRLDLYARCLPDSQSWRQLGSYAEPMVSVSVHDPVFGRHPITGITREAVEAYLSWMTEQYRFLKGKSMFNHPFILPTRAEWIRAAQAGDSTRVYPWGNGFIKNNRGDDLCNYRHVELLQDSLTGHYKPKEPLDPLTRFTMDVASFFPNRFGMYNMSGNAAEMVEEPGIACGGSFNDPAWLVRTSSVKRIDGASPEVGFRVAYRARR